MPPRSTLACLQQTIVTGAIAAATAWVAWMAPRSPGLALAGAAALLLGHAWFLAAEFLLLRWVGRHDLVPRATVAELLHAWAAEVLMGLRVFAWRQPFRWRAVPDHLQAPGLRGRHGVVFIHGFVCNRGFWNPWMRRLLRERRAFAAVNLEPVFTSIDDYAPTVERAVAQVREATGMPPVLVCHSMGGLVARAWLRSRPWQEACVAHIVTIGSPHRGTWLARWSRLANGMQMRLDSEWLTGLAHALASVPAVPFTCWHSNCDNIVMPPSTATLPGADNRLVRGAGHVDLAFAPAVVEGTLRLLDDVKTAQEPAAKEH